jgi:hypothetical protein
MMPDEAKRWCELARYAELAAARGDARLCLVDFGRGNFMGLAPYLVLIERILAAHLVFEVGE